AGQCNDVLGQLLLVVPAVGNAALRGAMLPQHTAYPALRRALRQNRANMGDAGTATREAQKIPRAASVRISLSSVRSATALRSRSFSFWSSVNCRSWSRLMPPYCLRHLQYVSSETPIWRTASAIAMPWPRKTSTCRSFVTISSGLCRLFAIVVLLHGQNHTSRWTRSMGVDQDFFMKPPGWGKHARKFYLWGVCGSGKLTLLYSSNSAFLNLSTLQFSFTTRCRPSSNPEGDSAWISMATLTFTSGRRVNGWTTSSTRSANCFLARMGSRSMLP